MFLGPAPRPTGAPLGETQGFCWRARCPLAGPRGLERQGRLAPSPGLSPSAATRAAARPARASPDPRCGDLLEKPPGRRRPLREGRPAGASLDRCAERRRHETPGPEGAVRQARGAATRPRGEQPAGEGPGPGTSSRARRAKPPIAAPTQQRLARRCESARRRLFSRPGGPARSRPASGRESHGHHKPGSAPVRALGALQPRSCTRHPGTAPARAQQGVRSCAHRETRRKLGSGFCWQRGRHGAWRDSTAAWCAGPAAGAGRARRALAGGVVYHLH